MNKEEVVVASKNYFIEETSHRFETNPFLEMMELKSTTKAIFAKTDALVTNQKTGEVMGQQVVATFKKVDADSFVKIFAHHLTSIFDLTRTGYRLLVIVIGIIQENSINRDIFYMSYFDASNEANKKEAKLSRDTFKKGVSELISMGIIARGMNVNSYYINPAIIYNGNRTKITFVEQYEVIPTKDYIQQNLLED